MVAKGADKELQVFNKVIAELTSLEKDSQARILRNVFNWLEIEFSASEGPMTALGSMHSMSDESVSSETGFSQRKQMSPKEFMMQKDPRTDVEKVACLAYYLTHFRATRHFKTLDISKLNTEAAQRKFSNTAFASQNAVRAGVIVQATKGHRQLSADGEKYVQALPDREAVKKVIKRMRKPRRKKKAGKKDKKNKQKKSAE